MNWKLWNYLWLVVFYCTCCSPSKNTVRSIEINDSDGPNPWTNLNWNNKSENFQFVVVTDRTGGNRPGVFEQGVAKVNLLQPEFVMSVGDLIQGYTDDLEALNREWDEFDSFVDRLEMPFFYVPGNHDITNKVMEDLWTERYGRTYYHFVYQNVLFLCLNSEETIEPSNGDGRYNTRDFYLSRAQRSYIKQTLDQHQDVRWTMLFWHKPVWLYQGSDNPELTEWIPQSGWPEVQNWLKDRKHTVFAGHIHRYDYQQINNNDYITLATTGGGSALRGPIFGQFDHVLWVTMTDDGPVMANLMLDGIFDKDFQKDDIENNLTLALQNKVVRVDNELDRNAPIGAHILELTLFNRLDHPVLVELQFDDTKHIDYAKNQVSLEVPPNNAERLQLDYQITSPASSNANQILQQEINQQATSWKLTYDYEKYGQIKVTGNTSLH